MHPGKQVKTFVHEVFWRIQLTDTLGAQWDYSESEVEITWGLKYQMFIQD